MSEPQSPLQVLETLMQGIADQAWHELDQLNDRRMRCDRASFRRRRRCIEGRTARCVTDGEFGRKFPEMPQLR